jgi:ParB-like chromosome segregation protein Spo0J
MGAVVSDNPTETIGVITGSGSASSAEFAEQNGQSQVALVVLPLHALHLSSSPRLDGLNEDHVRSLAEVYDELPPITVQRGTMTVIDGAHRVMAGKLAGKDSIIASYFDGSSQEAFQFSVKVNISHGLPLTLADRRAAAQQILLAHRELSDRAIGATTGLAAKTVASIRTGLDVEPTHVRIGRDGRARPLDITEARLIAGDAVAARPELTLREIASVAGISIGTARDVRARVLAGQDPVPAPRQRNQDSVATRALPKARREATNESTQLDQQALLQNLMNDPSLRYTESGRALIRWLAPRLVRHNEWRSMLAHISPHSALLVSKIARECARVWHECATQLECAGSDLV